MKKNLKKCYRHIDVQKEKDGKFTAFLEDAPYCWTGATTKEEALAGLKSLYPEVELAVICS